MERLTERWCAGGIRIKGCSTLYPDVERKSAPMASAIARLAAYEDTGLEPEEVQIAAEMFAGDPHVPILQTSNLVKAYRDGRVEILPPNDPLTMAELREMEGKSVPVWCDKVNGYIFIAVTKMEPYNKVWFFNHTGKWDTILYYSTKFYRRKPEEEI